MVTGYFDSKVFQQSKDLATKARELGVTAKTECAYIVPHSYNSFNSRSEVDSLIAQAYLIGTGSCLCVARFGVVCRIRRHRRISSRFKYQWCRECSDDDKRYTRLFWGLGLLV